LTSVQHVTGLAGVDLFIDTLDHQSIGDVLHHRHVGKQCVILENGIHVAFIGRNVAGVGAVNQDFAGGGPFEAGNQPEAGCLPGAGWAEHGKEFTVGHFKTDAVNGADLSIIPTDIFKTDSRIHVCRFYL
jgi:hypothetical protein